MATSFRSILACAAFATLGLAFACGNATPGNTRGDTGAGGDTGTTTAGSSGTGGPTGSTTNGTTTSGTTTAGTTTGGSGGAGATSTTNAATTGAAGNAASTVGSGGSTGTGGAGGAGGAALACGSNGQPYTGPLLGRCSPTSCADKNCGTSVAKGGFITLDDFETAATGNVTGAGVINMTWPSRDGRNGAWHQYSDPAANATMALAPAGGGGSPDSVQAIHYTGNKGMYGATLALPLGGAMASGEAGCYDASAYDGISFWIKGNAAAGNTQVKFNVQSPVSEPTISGGACTSGCYDHFSTMITLSATWTRVKIPWGDLKRQACAVSVPATPPNFQPQKQILAVSFQQVDPTKGFDFWIDDMTFDVDTKPASDFPHTVTQALFDEMFKAVAAPYTYQGLLSAVSAHGKALGGNANAVDNKQEVAAFLAHITHETGSLTTAREKCTDSCAVAGQMCAATDMHPCTAGAGQYYGRGALQLTGVANYQSAQSAGFAGIVATPDLVATDVDKAFGTAAWFWTTFQSAKGICHDAIVTAHDFGETTNIINGGIECVQGNVEQNSRIAIFRQFCAALGVNPRGKLTCP